MDLNLLIVFDALMRERNVSRAAEAIYRSQPAMSHALKRLRSQHDDQLMVRTTNGIHTPLNCPRSFTSSVRGDIYPDTGG